MKGTTSMKALLLLLCLGSALVQECTEEKKVVVIEQNTNTNTGITIETLNAKYLELERTIATIREELTQVKATAGVCNCADSINNAQAQLRAEINSLKISTADSLAQAIATFTAKLTRIRARITRISNSVSINSSSASSNEWRTAINSVQQNVNARFHHFSHAENRLQQAINVLTNEQYKSNFWTPIHRTSIGGYNFKGQAAAFHIPVHAVPHHAKQVLVQVEWSTGYTPLTQFYNTAIWTQHNDGRQFKFWASGWRQNVSSMYSDSQTIWLPIAETNRHVYVHCATPIHEARPNLHMGIHILGYK
jgi:hypothetical protein